jgi:hypothetical protein
VAPILRRRPRTPVRSARRSISNYIRRRSFGVSAGEASARHGAKRQERKEDPT